MLLSDIQLDSCLPVIANKIRSSGIGIALNKRPIDSDIKP